MPIAHSPNSFPRPTGIPEIGADWSRGEETDGKRGKHREQ